MLEYLDKLQKEDMESLLKKRETQRNLMKDVAQANEVSVILGLVHLASFSLLFALMHPSYPYPLHFSILVQKRIFVEVVVGMLQYFQQPPFLYISMDTIESSKNPLLDFSLLFSLNCSIVSYCS